MHQHYIKLIWCNFAFTIYVYILPKQFKMTKAIAIILLFVCSISIQAQTKDLDKQLLKKYSKKELASLKVDNPTEYEFAKYCVKNAFYTGKTSKEKIATNPNEYGRIKIKDLTNINFFELNIKLKEKDHQAFIINGSTNLLIIKSKNHILNELKKK